MVDGRLSHLKLRVAGGLVFLVGAASLVSLISPLHDWALRNNVTDLTALLDRRASNTVGATDTVETVVIGAVLAMLVGLWVGLGVPMVLDRAFRTGPDGSPAESTVRLGRWIVAAWIVIWLALLGGLALWAPWW